MSEGPFTYSHYRRLVTLAARTRRFRFLADRATAPEDPVVYWRHDIDLSLEGAVNLAQIEAEEGVRATYFIHLHSGFYHPWERRSADRIERIVRLGHEIGLHFDPAFYDAEDTRVLLPSLRTEAHFLSDLTGRPVRAFSLHNPTDRILSLWTDDTVLGLVNTYGDHFRQHVDYVSDSNGIWRHRSIEEALRDPGHQALQVLTHPVWWSREPGSPESKMLDCIRRRGEETEAAYRTEARVVVGDLPEPSEIRWAG